MSFLKQLSHLAIHQVLGDRAQSVMNFFSDRFSDCSQRVPRALKTAQERAWKTLEISLAGTSWWERLKMSMVAAEQLALSKQIRAYLDAMPLPSPPGGEPFKQICLVEMKSAYKVHHLPGGEIAFTEVQEYVKQFAHLSDPKVLLKTELQQLEGMVSELRRLGYPHLADYVQLRPDEAQPLLVMAVRYFFRREVESDPKLAAGLTFQQLEGLSEMTEVGFRNMHDALVQHHQQINSLLLDMHETLGDVHRVVISTDQKVSDVQKELSDLKQELQSMMKALMEKERATPPAAQTSQNRQDLDALQAQHEQEKQQLRAMYQTVIETLQKQPATPSASVPEPEVVVPAAQTSATPTDTGASPTSPQESWQQARSLLRQAKHLTSEQRQQMPTLARVVTRLQGAGLIENARPLEPVSGAGVENYPTHVPTYPQPEYAPPETTSPDTAALLGTIFQPDRTPEPVTESQEPKKPQESAGPAKSPKVISNIFLQGTSGPPATASSPTDPAPTGEAPKEPAGPKKGPRLISPLFQKPGKTDAKPEKG